MLSGIMRYPGSKAKIAKPIVGMFPGAMGNLLASRDTLWQSANIIEYREPFVGAGAIAIKVLHQLPAECPVHLRDADPWLICLWNAVRDAPDELSNRINSFTPSVEAFEQFKQEDGTDAAELVEAGFRKLALHQMSWSGLGAMSGGPLGGQRQCSEAYCVDCRFSKINLRANVRELHLLLQRFPRLRISCGDFEGLFSPSDYPVFLYCDPPYYEKGPQLYSHSMQHADHERLARCCRNTKHEWCVSYDDHTTVRQLYEGFRIREVELRYTTATAKQTPRRKNSELVITSERLP